MKVSRQANPTVRRFAFATLVLAGATASAIALADSDKARNPVGERRHRASVAGSSSARRRPPADRIPDGWTDRSRAAAVAGRSPGKH